MPCPIQLPIGAEDKLEGIIDLITMEEWVWKGEDLGASWARQPIRDELQGRGRRMARQDDRARRRDGRRGDGGLPGRHTSPTRTTLRKLIRKGTLAMKFVPVICGSAFKNKGVQPMLNAVIDYLPGPLDVPRLHGLPAGRRDRNPQHRALGRRRAAVLGPRVQDHERPVRGLADLHADLLGPAEEGRRHAELDQGQARAHWPHDDDARDQPRRNRRSLRRRHHRAGGSEGHDHGRHAVRPDKAGGSGDHDLPGAGDRDRGGAEDEGRTGEDGPRAWHAGRRRPSFASRPTSSRARRS